MLTFASQDPQSQSRAGEVVWRKEGDPQICLYERQRSERDTRGEKDTGDDEKPFKQIIFRS